MKQQEKTFKYYAVVVFAMFIHCVVFFTAYVMFYAMWHLFTPNSIFDYVWYVKVPYFLIAGVYCHFVCQKFWEWFE